MLPSTAAATSNSNSPLFQPQPLTNSVLEQIRIWEQAEADNLKYGGELERGNAGNKGQTSAYPQLLVPILVMAQELDTISQIVAVGNKEKPGEASRYYAELKHILDQPKYNKIEFKRVFNAFADNIYYSDPDRANLYLAGGGACRCCCCCGFVISQHTATPKTEQSLAYLLRNEILTNIENMRAEIDYLSRNLDDNDEEDLRLLATATAAAMQRYLAVVPPRELEQARALMTASSSSSSATNATVQQ